MTLGSYDTFVDRMGKEVGPLDQGTLIPLVTPRTTVCPCVLSQNGKNGRTDRQFQLVPSHVCHLLLKVDK